MVRVVLYGKYDGSSFPIGLFLVGLSVFGEFLQYAILSMLFSVFLLVVMVGSIGPMFKFSVLNSKRLRISTSRVGSVNSFATR